MKVSINHIKYYQQKYQWSGDPASAGVPTLVERIGAQLGAVEEVIPFGKKYENVLIAKVVACQDHPNADKLHVCKIDDGRQAQNVERDESGYVQVVCGAPNVREGLMVAWLPPGATVPSTYFDQDPFVLDARPLRGVTSYGMMASPRELGIGDSHEGILEITQDPDEPPLVPGTPFTEAYHLRGDEIIDIENKMFTHRPDCFGMMGVAREIAGIQGQQFKSPDWYAPAAAIPEPEADELQLEVRDEIPELVPRFTAVTLRGVEVKPSPLWLQIDLARVGLRPINNIVDYTNYFMQLTGQPLHAYDYDKVMALSEGNQATIVVRYPHEGETIALLNGKTIEPRREAIMIATDKQLIGIGGVMGGADTEVDEHTTNIILECATFDMYSIRRTSMAHGLFTDAVTRFTKGQSPLQNRAVLAKIVDEIRRFAGGKVAGPVVDDNHVPAETLERQSVHPPVTVSRHFINERLGLDLSAGEMAQLLRNVEFDVQVQDENLTVTAPFWRTDIEIREDVVEEVGRLYGFDHLPLVLPRRDLTPAVRDASLTLKSEVSEQLAKAGANEVLSYNFVHGNLFDKVGQQRDLAFRLGNALSPDLQYYRLSLLPSLLEKVHPNIKASHNHFALFEINKVHGTTEIDEEGLPREFMRLALVYAAEPKTAEREHTGAAYYQARQYLDVLFKHFGLSTDTTYQPFGQSSFEGHVLSEQLAKPFEPNRSAVIRQGERIVGIVGEYRASVQKALKLPAFTAGFELFLSALASAPAKRPYMQLPRFPKVEQDICLKVAADMPYQQLFDFVRHQLDHHKPDQVHLALQPIDIYQRQDDAAHKQITLRISIASYERTLTDQEVAKLLDHVAAQAAQQFSAERI